MRREDIIDLAGRMAPGDMEKLVLIMKVGSSVTIDTVHRFEADYMVVRGREAGTNDDGRGFFVPYAEIAYVRLERLVSINDFRRMYNEPLLPEMPLRDTNGTGADVTTPGPSAVSKTPVVTADPATIAKQNLLDRIKAARTSAGVPRK